MKTNTKWTLLCFGLIAMLVPITYLIIYFILQLVGGGEIDFDTVGSKDEMTLNLIANNDDYTPAQIALAA